jgi:hypothetical protein
MGRLVVFAISLLGAAVSIDARDEVIMGNPDSTYVRPPAVAGAFYPAAPAELAKTLADFFHRAPKPRLASKPLAIIAPHAGYVYSGQIAAAAYKLLEGENYHTVVVISPSHAALFDAVVAFDGRAYSTPLGEVPINKAFSAKLAAACDVVELSGRGHLKGPGRSEHALEVQLPFLQLTLGKFDLVALVMGDQDPGTCARLGEALAEVIGQDDGVLIVASSDLSHFHSSSKASRFDSLARRDIETLDYHSLAENLATHKTEACGGGPIIAAMIAATRLGADSVEITGFGDSGDASGDKSNVVGYLSAVIYRGEGTIGDSPEKTYELEIEPDSGDTPASPGDSGNTQSSLTESERHLLLSLARKSVDTYFSGLEPDLAVADCSPALSQPRGAFVTLHKRGELRGCIGTFHPDGPLYRVVAQMARQAAFSDYRFRPVTNRELDTLDIEISVLTPMKRICDPNQVAVGRDGLYIKRGICAGVLLPQVPVEQGWDREQFLDHTCLKAGLPAGAWKEKNTELYVFQAEVFGEGTL